MRIKKYTEKQIKEALKHSFERNQFNEIYFFDFLRGNYDK